MRLLYRFYLTSVLSILDLIREINDPEHPLTLEELNVVDCDHVSVSTLVFHQIN